MSEPTHRVSSPTYFAKPDPPTSYHGKMHLHPSAEPHKSGQHGMSEPTRGVSTPTYFAKPDPPTSHHGEMRSRSSAPPQKSDRQGMSEPTRQVSTRTDFAKPDPPTSHHGTMRSRSSAPPQKSERHALSRSRDDGRTSHNFAEPYPPASHRNGKRSHSPYAGSQKCDRHGMSEPTRQVSTRTDFAKPDPPTSHHGTMRSRSSAPLQKSERHALSRSRDGSLTSNNFAKPYPPASHRSGKRSHSPYAGSQKSDRHGSHPYDSPQKASTARHESRKSHHSHAPPKRDAKHELASSSDKMQEWNFSANLVSPTDHHGGMRSHHPLVPSQKDDLYGVEFGQRKLTKAYSPTLHELDQTKKPLSNNDHNIPLKERFDILFPGLIEQWEAEKALQEKVKDSANDTKKTESLRQLSYKNPNIDCFGVPIPPPSKPCEDLWGSAKTHDNIVYYYNKVTRKAQWHPPTPEQGILEPGHN